MADVVECVVVENKQVLQCKMCALKGLSESSLSFHILGKKHRKIAASRNLPTLYRISHQVRITGLPDFAVLEKDLMNYFISKYSIIDARFFKKFMVLEFSTQDAAQEALKSGMVFKGTKLSLKPHTSNDSTDESEKSTTLSQANFNSNLMEKMTKIETSSDAIDNLFIEMMYEIELKLVDYAKRDRIRVFVESFLRQTFVQARVYIFGSSKNNLGFVGCDVDLVADLGFDAWNAKTKLEGDKNAADLTRYIAKGIKKLKIGHRVVPISNARVPIVKFVDHIHGLEVDLSFKNGMPIFNTALIHLYSTIHPIVRPYLMMLRLWAKVQMIAGGGKPRLLLTNYSFTMMMLFWLMLRQDPIVPCVGELQDAYKRQNNIPIVIDGWDCSFSDQVNHWKSKYHQTSILSLMTEFFDFYGNLDSKEWAICVLAGILIRKDDLVNPHPSYVPQHLRSFYTFQIPIRVQSPLCIQDPFEWSHNITHGLSDKSLAAFQMKCLKAASICKEITEGKATVGDLFDQYDVDCSALPEENYEVTVVDEDRDEVCVNSDDSIELLQELESLKRMEGTNKKDFPEQKPGGIISDELKRSITKNNDDSGKNTVKTSEDQGNSKVSNNELKSDSDISVIKDVKSAPKYTLITLDSSPEKKESKSISTKENIVSTNGSGVASKTGVHTFTFDFESNKYFEILPGGRIKSDDTKKASKDEIVEKLWTFILTNCLKCDVQRVDVLPDTPNALPDETTKRKNDFDESVPTKYLKGSGHERIPQEKGITIAKHVNKAPYKIWEGRKKLSKSLIFGISSPLEHEVTVSNCIVKNEVSGTGVLLHFETILSRKVANSNAFSVTCKCNSLNIKTQNTFFNFFSFFARLTQNLAKKMDSLLDNKQ